ncbi:MAG: glycosyltransferase [Anaerolineales bacterium]|jgi:glycosyltransferase involved in cell wall biosynthesis
MRIAIAGQTYYPASNGQSTFTVNLAEGLARRGHQVLALVPSQRGGAYQLIRHQVEIQALPSVGLSFLHPETYLTLNPLFPVRAALERFQPEVVHIQDPYPISRVAAQEARRRGIRLVGTNHFVPENIAPYIPVGQALQPALGWALWQWVLGLYNRLDVATTPSKTAAEIIHRRGLRVPVFPISCGVNLKRFGSGAVLNRQAMRARYGLDPQRRLFLFVGRVDREKRVDVLLRALALLHRADLQLAVTGRGAEWDSMRRLAALLGLEGSVQFTGYVPDDDLPGLMHSADVFVMPSEAELLSIATLEAMASGLPILAARAKALPELVSEGVNGYLFRAGDALDAARHMAILADHPERLPEMGAASLERAQLHSLEDALRNYEKIYERVLSESGALASAYPSRLPLGRKRMRGVDARPWHG